MRTQKVEHLKVNGGRYYYRRRVPTKHQKTLGIKNWNRPCGKVSYQQAVVLVTEWTAKHDAMIEALDNPETAIQVRQETEADMMAPLVAGMVKAQRAGSLPPSFDPLDAARAGYEAASTNPNFDDQDRLVRFRAIHESSFGSHVVPPTNPDERDEFDLVKRKLERRITELGGNPNTITAMSEAYFKKNQIKTEGRNKYRRVIKRLIAQVGDIPLEHLNADRLREFRDAQPEETKASSLQSLFTPIRGMFKYAIGEGKISDNPMPAVVLKPEKRSTQMRKYQPFSPAEVRRIFAAMDEFWGSPMRGLSEERRLAIHMVCRVQAFTAMRPKEVLHLLPENVTDKSLVVIGSKTEGSDRSIPLHPAISDFPDFFHAGGFDTFLSQEKDRVQSVRHNFANLIRSRMDPPILDKKKVLYSWRSTFSNAMRRARASEDMRRAILGHEVAGSLAHYDDGPQFFKKREWVRASDPRIDYPDPGEDDDLD
jgi:integrase